MKTIAALVLLLASGGQTDYRIVVSESADVSTRAVAEDFADLLRQITGATFPMVTDATPAGEAEIVIGDDNRRLAALGLANFTNGFADGEYEIRSAGKHLIIAGAGDRGTINGIYGFLQDHLDCRFFTPGVTRIPTRDRLEVTLDADRRRPAFRWRSMDPPMHWDAAWTARNRLNECKTDGGPASLELLMGDPRVRSLANYFSPHQFSYIPRELFDEHPEYFAEIDGRRVCHDDPNQRAYCVTNEGFAAFMAQMVRAKLELEGQRGPHRVAITHADNGNYCQCAACKADYERHGVSGTYMTLANRVALRLAGDFPEAVIHTLAYGTTYQPTTVELHPSVRVVWCPIGECYAHGFDECAANTDPDTVGKLQQWLDNTRQLGVWYYQYQADVLMPHPKLHAMKRNFALFQRMGADGVFVEDNRGSTVRRPREGFDVEPDGDKPIPAYGDAARNGCFTTPFGLNHIKSYIAARLLWDTDYDVEQGIREFCETYYGPSGDEVAEYVLLVESLDSYERTMGSRSKGHYPGVHLSNSQSPLLKWLVIERMDALFDAAEQKVADDDVLLRRVRLARMGLQLAILCHEEAIAQRHRLRDKAFTTFFSLGEQMNFQRLDRTGLTPQRMSFAQFKEAAANATAADAPAAASTDEPAN